MLIVYVPGVVVSNGTYAFTVAGNATVSKIIGGYGEPVPLGVPVQLVQGDELEILVGSGGGTATVVQTSRAPGGPLHAMTLTTDGTWATSVTLGLDTGSTAFASNRSDAWTLTSQVVQTYSPQSFQFAQSIVAESGSTPTPVSSIAVSLGFVVCGICELPGHHVVTEVGVCFASGRCAHEPPAWTSVFDLDGLSFLYFDGTIEAAPGVTVSSLGVVANANARCAFAFFLDGPNARLNGAPYPPPLGRRLLADNATFAQFSWGDSNTAPQSAAVLVASFDPSGQPISAGVTRRRSVPARPLPGRVALQRAAVRARHRRRLRAAHRRGGNRHRSRLSLPCFQLFGGLTRHGLVALSKIKAVKRKEKL